MNLEDSRLSKFQDLTLVSQLNQANFGVFLSYSPSMNHYFALKIFPYKRNRINPFFENEVRFSGLQHRNIISPLYSEAHKTIKVKEKDTNISFTVMEFAPYGDFFDILLTKKISFDDKLIRTYFHQLISGLEFLHSREIAHLDIKPDNLLLGTNFQLKISDFDHSFFKEQSQISPKGTLNYRAPEISEGVCQNYKAADIYSAGIVLFLFKSGGMLPYLENKLFDGVDLFKMLHSDPQAFWQKHCEVQKRSSLEFDEDFKALFTGMTQADPSQRPSLAEIKQSKWFNGPIYSERELVDVMKKKIKLETH